MGTFKKQEAEPTREQGRAAVLQDRAVVLFLADCLIWWDQCRSLVPPARRGLLYKLYLPLSCQPAPAPHRLEYTSCPVLFYENSPAWLLPHSALPEFRALNVKYPSLFLARHLSGKNSVLDVCQVCSAAQRSTERTFWSLFNLQFISNQIVQNTPCFQLVAPIRNNH